ncbi:unnamed protein product [Haemonchus placei]|uniref:Transposase n=1 Tax=Haemonchus placei TaxID=6290 RepID=A0A0N4WK63_HAEPC|nr:unnamed protein product [Haemonchus placei]
MFETASAVTSEGAFETESTETTHPTAQGNGYGCDGLPARRIRRARMEHAQEEEHIKELLRIPFVSDDMGAAISACLWGADLQDSVRVVEIHPSSLKGQLLGNRLYDR